MSEYILERLDNMCRDLKRQSVIKNTPLSSVEFVPCGYKQDNTPPETGWQPFANGSRLQGKDGHYWLKAEFDTENCDSCIEYRLNVTTGREGNVDALNPQGIVYLNGKTVQGTDINHTDVSLSPGTHYEMYLYLYIGMIDSEIPVNLSVSQNDTRIEQLYYDIKVPLESCRCLEKCSDEFAAIAAVLEQAANMVSFREIYSEEYYRSIESAALFLHSEFYEKLCRKTETEVHCIGHTHIDVAWQWTYAQTREKVQRSFATVLALMKEYPEYIFMSSQPQLFEYLKEESPELYSQVKQRVKEGRFEVEGGMWLEADCNLICGESIVRQILFGKRFFKSEFDKDSKILWLPDVFGYSAALPQILRKSGIDDFVTSKISWNDTNTMPYDTFVWRGIDGSCVTSHFITAQWMPHDRSTPRVTSYVGRMSPQMILGARRRYQQKEFNPHVAITYGFGDGGGGPTREMLEFQRRTQSGIPGIPATRMSTAAEWVTESHNSFYKSAEKLHRMPQWTGELYLELHRGTYTSIAKNKRNNRKSEMLLIKAEQLSVTAGSLLDEKYPKAEIDRCWKSVLLNQFHDVLPGSSIHEVYEDTDVIYKEVMTKADEIADSCLKKIAGSVSAEKGCLIYNPCGFKASGIVRTGGITRETKQDIPASGWSVIQFEDTECRVTVGDYSLENHAFALKFDKSGRIISLFDKSCCREVFENNRYGNEIQFFEDIPRGFDAWEISDYYKQKQWILEDDAEIEPVYDGDRRGLRFTHKYLSSVIVQTVYLYDSMEQIDFETEADWNEKHQLVKAAFPFAVSAEKASYEIQFGFVERPTHGNTGWDAAKFEVCAHRFADVSEYDYGVSLINDCKYGHNCEGGTLKLTLLKCAEYPDISADRGHHSFKYALIPHKGDFRAAGVIEKAYLFNQPLMCAPVTNGGGSLPDSFSLVSTDCPGVIVETVKQAEDGNGIIVRMYESFGGSSDGSLAIGIGIKKAYFCDLMENNTGEALLENNNVKLKFSKFEIITLRLIPE